jgi:hypothetical protein
MLAKRASSRSVSNYFNGLISLETQKMIYAMGDEEAAKKAARELNIPESVGLALRQKESKECEATLGYERAIKFLKTYNAGIKVESERIAAELNFDIENEAEDLFDN